MIDTLLIDTIKNYYPLFLLFSVLLTAIAMGYRHMIIPALGIFLMFGYRFYHRQHEHFLSAVEHGETSKVKYYLKWYANPNYTSHGITPLIIASQEGHTEIVKLLLDNGATIQATDKSENTAAHGATRNNHQEIVNLLNNSKTI